MNVSNDVDRNSRAYILLCFVFVVSVFMLYMIYVKQADVLCV